jgi:hypothetical protein
VSCCAGATSSYLQAIVALVRVADLSRFFPGAEYDQNMRLLRKSFFRPNEFPVYGPVIWSGESALTMQSLASIISRTISKRLRKMATTLKEVARQPDRIMMNVPRWEQVGRGA